MSTSSLHAGFCLARACYYSLCEFMCTTALLCPENTLWLLSSTHMWNMNYLLLKRNESEKKSTDKLVNILRWTKKWKHKVSKCMRCCQSYSERRWQQQMPLLDNIWKKKRPKYYASKRYKVQERKKSPQWKNNNDHNRNWFWKITERPEEKQK